jgi:hypothetical protein
MQLETAAGARRKTTERDVHPKPSGKSRSQIRKSFLRLFCNCPGMEIASTEGQAARKAVLF